jgi:anti-sigma factor RsiW
VSCELTPSVLHGYIDGELDAARAADFEQHLLSCPQCVAALEAQENLRATLRRGALYERAPALLRLKIEEQLGTGAAAKVPEIPRRTAWQNWQWLAAAAVFLLAAFIGWRTIPGWSGNPEQNQLASAIVDAHLRSLQPGHLVDVVSTDQHTVKPWFDGKIDFAPPVRDFASDGFPLQGGRLDILRGHQVAVLVYGRRKHVINVFIWPISQPDTKPQSGTQLGYNWIDWRTGGMEMCAVSDVSATDLNTLVALLSK